MINVSDKTAFVNPDNEFFLQAANARLYAKRAARARLKERRGTPTSIPIKSAGELVDSLMRLIESRIVWVDTEQGKIPIADAMERGLAWVDGRGAEQGALITTIAGGAGYDD